MDAREARDPRHKARDRLALVRQEVVAEIAEEERLHQRRREYDDLVDRWSRRVALAMRHGRDDLARQAVARLRQYEAQRLQCGGEFDRQRRRVAALKRDLQLVEAGSGLTSANSTGASALHLELIFGMTGDPLEDKLAALERADRLDRELAELKARLAGTDPPEKKLAG